MTDKMLRKWADDIEQEILGLAHAKLRVMRDSGFPPKTIESFEGKQVRDRNGNVLGILTNPRVESGYIVADFHVTNKEQMKQAGFTLSSGLFNEEKVMPKFLRKYLKRLKRKRRERIAAYLSATPDAAVEIMGIVAGPPKIPEGESGAVKPS